MLSKQDMAGLFAAGHGAADLLINPGMPLPVAADACGVINESQEGACVLRFLISVCYSSIAPALHVMVSRSL